ncbi:MAG TPA: AMP-binding protein [Candidatus Acidoferrales bacterium]|nr:AMP-binding protein [Candidatus Acidoferrales bacterium]
MPVGDLIRSNAVDTRRAQRIFLKYEEWQCTFADYYAECSRWARLLLKVAEDGSSASTPSPQTSGRPFHVGILLDNIPDYFFALGGAMLAGAVVSGINNTKRGSHLARDIAYTDCRILVTEDKYLSLLDPVLDETGVAPQGVLVTRRWDEGSSLTSRQSHKPSSPQDVDQGLRDLVDASDPKGEVNDKDIALLVFTSGTVTAPKAVMCSQGRLVETGKNVGLNTYQLTENDAGYIAMPLFHANALMCGWLPALYYGVSLGMIRKFSKTRWLSDIRRYGATFFNYTGKPLAYILSTPPQPDDHVNPLRICYGNEGSNKVVAEFEQRFGCKVIDVFGSSEGGVGVTRQPTDPPNSIGFPAFGIQVVDEHGQERTPARFDASGRLLNADEAVGEIVNTLGVGWFEGYYKNDEAMQQRTRNGWYWSGDLGYKDEKGYLYFAGRDIEWLRVDGENFVARPIEEILHRHPDVVLAAIYGVPDPDGGDRVMAALILREGAVFDLQGFAIFLREQPDLSPKWLPTFVRIANQLPQTASSKVIKTELRKQKFRLDRCGDPIYWRSRIDQPFALLSADDYEALLRRFVAVGREGALDL